jgi:hypothetical protein
METTLYGNHHENYLEWLCLYKYKIDINLVIDMFHLITTPWLVANYAKP